MKLKTFKKDCLIQRRDVRLLLTNMLEKTHSFKNSCRRFKRSLFSRKKLLGNIDVRLSKVSQLKAGSNHQKQSLSAQSLLRNETVVMTL